MLSYVLCCIKLANCKPAEGGYLVWPNSLVYFDVFGTGKPSQTGLICFLSSYVLYKITIIGATLLKNQLKRAWYEMNWLNWSVFLFFGHIRNQQTMLCWFKLYFCHHMCCIKWVIMPKQLLKNQPKKNECLPTLLNWLGWSPLLHFSSFGTRKPFYAGLSCVYLWNVLYKICKC